jgi:hypothetical protein
MLNKESATQDTTPPDTTRSFESLDLSGDVFLLFSELDALIDYLQFAVPFSERESPRLVGSADHRLLIDPNVRDKLSNPPLAEMQLASHLAIDGVAGRTVSLEQAPSGTIVDDTSVLLPLAVEAGPYKATLHSESVSAFRQSLQRQFNEGDQIQPESQPVQDVAAKASRLVFSGFEDAILLGFRIWQHQGTQSSPITQVDFLLGIASITGSIEFPELADFAEASGIAQYSTLLAARERLENKNIIETKKVQRKQGRPRYRLQPGSELAEVTAVHGVVQVLDTVLD